MRCILYAGHSYLSIRTWLHIQTYSGRTGLSPLYSVNYFVLLITSWWNLLFHHIWNKNVTVKSWAFTTWKQHFANISSTLRQFLEPLPHPSLSLRARNIFNGGSRLPYSHSKKSLFYCQRTLSRWSHYITNWLRLSRSFFFFFSRFFQESLSTSQE